MVSVIILAYRKGWTIKEMLEQIDFNLLTRTALGLNRMDDTAFCEATFFNFQNRLLKHFVETGENLLERVFDGLTEEQLKKLKIKTDIKEIGLIYGNVKYPQLWQGAAIDRDANQIVSGSEGRR
jgi:hypothetical protein